MGFDKKTARFHVNYGPAELFERVRKVMGRKTTLSVNSDHAQEMIDEREPPIELLRSFNADNWELMLAETRVDNGKFQSTTWRRTVEDVEWWLTIGLHDAVVTIYPANEGKVGAGAQIVTEGPVYEKVKRVNSEL